MNKLLLTLLSIVITVSSYATTWDEPWQKEIIQKSEYFALGKVVSANDSLVTIEITKSFGKNISGIITIDNFFLLDLCSSSGGHGAEFIFEKGEEGYLFLKKGINGNYQIPTPTSGFDRIVDKKVHATYRHTYHQAAIPVEIYEFTYKEIWNKYHSGTFKREPILEFINENLSKEPASFEEDEIELFFRQHAALETAYLLDIHLDFDILRKFASCENFHSRVAAIRVMYNLNNDQVKTYLLEYLLDKDKDDFTKVIAIWSLWKMDDSEIRKRLWKMRKKLSDEDNGFGGNIMDPRVCTHFPSPQYAIIELKENKTMANTIYSK
tara:strand:+ start:69 stop:1037 length:969 start_codon:yes stop_codon:yes gene_type:complete